ncbi:hypothetical protein [Methylocapsa aurea]|uniref:hypothetical protein n=1 Tax=Methylocapsa aurea TaxID=663610 RepID=UPI0012EBB63A|nr:hypothetical protein [Methylocapsa aurea]
MATQRTKRKPGIGAISLALAASLGSAYFWDDQPPAAGATRGQAIEGRRLVGGCGKIGGSEPHWMIIRAASADCANASRP